MSNNTALKVALVHDYLREYGGAERVLESLHEIFPDAPVYTAFVDQKLWDKIGSVLLIGKFIKVN